MKNKNQFTYLLSTTCKYEFAISCCDSLTQMSNETGIPFNQLWDSVRKNQTCCGGRYKVHKIDISEPEEFDFDTYLAFCEIHNIKPCKADNLRKFKRLLDIFKK